MTTAVRIGNCSGFYGDRVAAMREMLPGGDLDFLTGDYRAELTMPILGRDKMKSPERGYAKTFLKPSNWPTSTLPPCRSRGRRHPPGGSRWAPSPAPEAATTAARPTSVCGCGPTSSGGGSHITSPSMPFANCYQRQTICRSLAIFCPSCEQ